MIKAFCKTALGKLGELLLGELVKRYVSAELEEYIADCIYLSRFLPDDLHKRTTDELRSLLKDVKNKVDDRQYIMIEKAVLAVHRNALRVDVEKLQP